MNRNNVRKGVIVMNLGSPESTDVAVVKQYLDEFLMDKKVMDYPYLMRRVIVKGMITPRRAPKSAEAYKNIWWPEGSPLIVLTHRLRDALQQKIQEPVEIAMRYGNPSPKVAFEKLMKQIPGMEEVLVIPLYPHYAMSSYETAFEYVQKIYKKNKYPFRLKVIAPFYKDPGYIRVLANSIRPYLQKDFDYLLFSYHGIPVRHIKKSDITGNHCLQSEDCCITNSPAHQFCYRHQVLTTSRLTAEALGLPACKFGNSFQSRLGKDEWLRPYTANVFEELPKKGIKKLLVATPAFAGDCLETLEEIGMEGKELFMQAGGEFFETIPCLNTDPQWVDLLASWIEGKGHGEERKLFNK